jgi:hypothetical protein
VGLASASEQIAPLWGYACTLVFHPLIHERRRTSAVSARRRRVQSDSNWLVQFENGVRRPILLATLRALQIELTARRAVLRVDISLALSGGIAKMRCVYERLSEEPRTAHELAQTMS